MNKLSGPASNIPLDRGTPHMSRGEFTLRQGLDRCHSPGGSRERVDGMLIPALSPEHASPLAFPPTRRLPK